MSFLLLALACAVFAQATSEFMLAGLVTDVADEFGVPVAVAGWSTSAFAVGMVVGAPLMAWGARRVPPRTSLAAFLAVFVAMHVVGALTMSFPVLLGSRVIAALANAGFLAVALGVAVRAVPPGRTARAASTLLAGTTLALIAGVPLGALLGQMLGWRSTFWVVGALAAGALIGVLAVRMPPFDPAGRPSVAREIRALRRRPVVLTLVVAALVNAGTFAVYTYLAPLVGAPIFVPVVLALFGVGAFLGVSAAGRWADVHYRRLLVGGGAALLGGWVLLGVVGGNAVAVLVLAAVMGLLAFGVGMSVIARSLALAPDAPTMGGSVTTAALNVGATLGPVLGGLGLAAGPVGPVWVAVGLVALAALPAGASLRG